MANTAENKKSPENEQSPETFNNIDKKKVNSKIMFFEDQFRLIQSHNTNANERKVIYRRIQEEFSKWMSNEEYQYFKTQILSHKKINDITFDGMLSVIETVRDVGVNVRIDQASSPETKPKEEKSSFKEKPLTNAEVAAANKKLSEFIGGIERSSEQEIAKNIEIIKKGVKFGQDILKKYEESSTDDKMEMGMDILELQKKIKYLREKSGEKFESLDAFN